ncbi:ParA family protein [Paracoccus yeei]
MPLAKKDSDLYSKATSGNTIATCFFNNKGGVGKTTLVANLAAELSINFNAKILVVDADPQCNITQLVLGEDYSYDLYSKQDPSTIYSVIHPLSLGKGFGDEFPIHKSDDWGFDMIVGDPRSC